MHVSPRVAFPDPLRKTAHTHVLVVFCHPRAHRSRVNRALRESAGSVDGVTIHDLYERYPDGAIDVPFEQDLLERHGAVVLQHPFYWYSTPPLLKEWLDVVLQWGWAYGHGGTRLHGKPLMQAITTGAPEMSYHPGGANRFTMLELLAPMIQTARLCGMPYRDPFVVHGTHRIDEAGIAEAAVAYADVLRQLSAEVAR